MGKHSMARALAILAVSCLVAIQEFEGATAFPDAEHTGNVALLQSSIGAECHAECGTGQCKVFPSDHSSLAAYSCTVCPAGKGLLVAQPKGTTLNPGTENRGQCKSFDDVQARDGNCQIQCMDRSYGYTIELGKSGSGSVQSDGVLCSKVCRAISRVMINSIKHDTTFAKPDTGRSDVHCDVTKIVESSPASTYDPTACTSCTSPNCAACKKQTCTTSKSVKCHAITPAESSSAPTAAQKNECDNQPEACSLAALME